jgi:hypothetical protein
MTPAELIQHYGLLPHPEGGWFCETYKSAEYIPGDSLPGRFNGPRSFATAIYFLLEQGSFSAFHKIKSDECWHFYSGGCLLIYIIFPSGNLEIVRLGSDIKNGEVFQYVVPANCWFASCPAKDSQFSFVGCTVAPGFDFNDFEMADAERLYKSFPSHKDIVLSLCKNS